MPNVETLAVHWDLTTGILAAAVRQLELEGLILVDGQGCLEIGTGAASRYQARGVSTDKQEVHDSIRRLDAGLFPGAFCKITADLLGGDPNLCNIIHSDGSGTKAILAYLHYRETGDSGVFRGIAQDSIVMNLDDLICVGATDRILLSSTINRNSFYCPGEVVKALIEGTEEFLANMRDQGLQIRSGGGETADVGDLTGTLLVDTTAVAVMPGDKVVDAGGLEPGLAIVGLASDGQSSYETRINSGIGSNGLTSARHDLLCDYYGRTYPESWDRNIRAELAYCGPYRLDDRLPDSSMSVGAALLSPTRTYAPMIHRLLSEARDGIRALIHCSGGGQTKCIRFGQGLHFVKDQLFPIPPIFRAIQRASATDWREMYQVYNLGHRMEVYCEQGSVDAIIEMADAFGIRAARIGYTEASGRKCNQLTIRSPVGDLTYPERKDSRD